MKSRPKIKPHQTTLIVAALATLVGFLLPVVQKILLPLQYLNTHLHEFSHAMVAILTGAEVDYLGAQEWAVTAQDVLWRRTKLGLRLDDGQVDKLKTYLGA